MSLSHTIIGVILSICASLLNAIGYVIQKKGHNRLKKHNQTKQDSEKKRIIKEKIWAVGFAIYLIGGLLNAISLFYAPQSLVLPLSAITLVANTLLSTKVLDEPFFKADLCGILLVIIGSVLAVIFGPKTSGGEPTMNELKLRWIDDDFFPFFIILSVCIALDYLIVRYYERNNIQNSLLCTSYCLLAGFFGSLSFLFLKSFTAFIASSISSKRIININTVNWYSYLTLICIIFTNLALEFFRQKGLSYFNAVYVVPINQVVLIVLGTILGGLYFEEFDNLNRVDGAMFGFAILLTVIGVFILAINSGISSQSLSTSQSTTDDSHDSDIILSDMPDLLPSQMYGFHRALSSLSALSDIGNENQRRRDKINGQRGMHSKSLPPMPVHQIVMYRDDSTSSDDGGIII